MKDGRQQALRRVQDIVRRETGNLLAGRKRAASNAC